MSIQSNLSTIKAALAPEVTLVAVSKTKSNSDILEAYAAGQRDFGENYVQELVEKAEALPKDIRWHYIGHLQSNKVKYIAPFVHLIHGVDSFKLLQEINKQGLKNDRVIGCLLQVFIAREESKFGFDFNEVEALLSSVEFQKLSHVRIYGLMGMATNTSDKVVIRNEFRSLAQFYTGIKQVFTPRANLMLSTLSMGMSSDYHMAIEEGSTMLRIGSSIFGARNSSSSSH